MIEYERCKNCVLPSTKPDLSFDAEGVCSACQAFAARRFVDWDARALEFEELLKRHSSNGTWDCIIPVSGGKDSTAQVIKILSLGKNPLCVAARTCDLTPIGRRNLDNLSSLGVDLVELSPNPRIRARLNRIGLELVGDISWPEHVSIFTAPVQIAAKYEIPLIIWGENSQNEYGGPATSQDSPYLNRAWLEEFGGLLGLRVSDLVASGEFSRQDLEFYTYPSDEVLERVGVTGLFLGHYFPWDGLGNALVSTAFGFESSPTATQGSIVGYENLDNYQAGIHEYFKYIKFGFGRATDMVSNHIRRGRLTREVGLQIVRERDGEFPSNYLGKSIVDVLHKVGLSLEQFDQIVEQHINRDLFESDADGKVVFDSLRRPKLNE